MTYSFEIGPEHRDTWPPFSDACPACHSFNGTVVPYATTTEGEQLTAFYRHQRCGHQWACRWSARWDTAWVRSSAA